MPAAQVSVSPNAGYTLNVTGFSADLRRSPAGPVAVRFAYSTDGGTTWTDQGIDQSPNNAGCGVTTTATWATTATVVAPAGLKFRVYGYNAASSGGTVQILNVVINGTVTTSIGCGIPSSLTATLVTAISATLNWAAVSGAVNYNIRYRPSGTSTWSTATSGTTSVAVSGLVPGTIYEFQVQTVCAAGSGTYSSSSYFTTLPVSTSASSGKMAIYFNTPVNTTVSTGVNAIYLNSCMADTLIAYINRAKYSIDIAQYDYNQSSRFGNIATAVNNAYLAGKKVRWIYDGSQPNTGLSLLNPGIHKVASPTSSAYGIMHDKFVIIDANSTNPNDAVVSTGSEDWGVTQFNSAPNNILFIQDSSLAHAYLAQFNMMWGDTGVIPNPALQKFGPYKTDLGNHIFHIGGKTLELYFSPSDHTDSHIQTSINSANTDLYFGVYTFTQPGDANAIVAKHTAGIYTPGIVDQYSITSGSAYTILSSGLGSLLKTYTSSSAIYHNKMMIVDASNTCSDPLVLTGSHNWTNTADTKNDENTLIIHSDTVANIYYQSFYANYTALGGSITAIAPCIPMSCGTPTGILATSITSTTALLNWTSVSGATAYTVQYRPVGTSTWNTVIAPADTITITGLTPATNYEFQVGASCSSMTGSFSSSVNFTTLALPCSVPSGLYSSGVISSSATLNWIAVAGATSYNIRYRIVGATTWSMAYSPVNFVTISGLTPGSSYEYEVQTVCTSGTTAYSATDNFTTPIVTCAVPMGLGATAITSTSAVLNWGAVAGAIGYSVQYRVPGTLSWSHTASTTNSVTLSGLTSGTTYEYQVQAICSSTDSSGFGPSSLFITVSLTTLVPGAILDNDFQVYPNPVSHDATFRYALSAPGKVTVSVCNLLGQEVLRIADREWQAPGSHGYNGTIAVPGVYFARLTIDDNTVCVRKIIKL
jgi:hypothetical protein